MKYIIVLMIILLGIQSCMTEDIDSHVSGKVIGGNLNGLTWQNTNFRIGFSGNCTKAYF